MSERDPLLARNSADSSTDDSSKKPHVGPLDISRSTRYGILAGIWTATFLSVSNRPFSSRFSLMLIFCAVLPSISSEFNKYLLATCTFTPLYGRLSNVLGRRRANQTALLFAGLGVLMCGLSRSMETLILARFLAGMGGGGLMTTSSRGLTQGIASVFNGLGLGLGGPLAHGHHRLGWRWAFLIQIPIFLVSYTLTSINLNYTTEGAGKNPREILRRIDYFGSGSLMCAVGSTLVFLSVRYNETLPWSHPAVIVSFIFAVIFAITFIFVEFRVAREPVLAPFLLKQKIPVLVGLSNFLVATCNFSIVYFFPMWFQTVMMTNASTAGLHLMPNSFSMSIGSVFAGWMMHATGRYKAINLIFGALPFIGATLVYTLREDAGPIRSWFSIVPLGFGNAVVLQTMMIALLVHLPEDCMAVGTGFGQLFRGVGQVGGVAVSSAIFQSRLEKELRARIHTPDADDLIRRIRQSARLVQSLPPDQRRLAQDAYSISLKSVFFFAACSTLLAYIVRLPIPDSHLDHVPRRRKPTDSESQPSTTASSSLPETPFESDDEGQTQTPASAHDDIKTPGGTSRLRRLSTYEDDHAMISDLEHDRIEIEGERSRKRVQRHTETT
ncbi:major facilitator superfamily domain-containing protein [Panaeolus papilionaceus]|nr:major facilitator superfamily domain-containing protein [Panaeolus papilionaceus]